MTTTLKQAPDAVATNVRQLIAGTEDLLHTIRSEGGDRYRDAIERMDREIERIKDELDNLQDTASMRARRVARRTDRLVHSHPWETAGAAAAAGMLLGGALGVLVVRALWARPD
jgi:ElaB/YqjD/DUF883 family membrane-anchored ribosome-binding protein